jgi:hypothetical protein
MNDLRPFAATNEDGTCLWCGRQLQLEGYAADGFEHVPEGSQITKVREIKGWRMVSYIPPGMKPGYRENGYFCCLRCAFQFAVAMAKNGRRLETKRP